jgi:hypothetical protein
MNILKTKTNNNNNKRMEAKETNIGTYNKIFFEKNIYRKNKQNRPKTKEKSAL